MTRKHFAFCAKSYNGMTMVDVTKGVKVGGATVFFIDIDRMQKF